jgi:hypothetical protein
MISQLPLKRTWFELGAQLERPVNPLRILRVINCLEPRTWSFTLSFDLQSRNLLRIATNPALSREAAEHILDATIPELFACDDIMFAGDQPFIAEPARYLSERPLSNILELGEVSTSQDDTLTLRGLFGHRTPQALQSGSQIGCYLSDNTWIGRHARNGDQTMLRWTALGATHAFRPRDRMQEATRSAAITFDECIALIHPIEGHIGEARVVGAETIESSVVFHSRHGHIHAPNQFMRELKRTGVSLLIEIRESFLDLSDADQLEPFNRASIVFEVVAAQINRLSETASFGRFLRDLDESRRRRSADGLKARQAKVQSAEMVYFREHLLMAAPRSENETVALLCKLEQHKGALPISEFKLVEYTSRAGIDSLAHFQINPQDARMLFAPVEVEYEFENFFDHDHYPAQAAMVICWAFRTADEDLDASGLTTVRPGLYYYRPKHGEAGLWVLVLSRIPRLSVTKEAK